MSIDSSGQPLHDRATRGETLTPEERQRLDAWYAAQDQMEATGLGLAKEPSAVLALRRNIAASVAELQTVVGQIQRLTTDNELLRCQNAELQIKLSQRFIVPRA